MIRFATPAPSLRAQLTAWLAPPLVVVLALSTFVSYYVAQHYAERAFDVALQDATRSLGELVLAERDSLDRLPPSTRLLIESDPEDQVYFRVLDPEGRPLTGNSAVPLPDGLELAPGKVFFYDAAYSGKTVRGAALAVAQPGGKPIATVLYAETLKKRQVLARALFVAVLLPQIVLAAIALGLLSLGVRRALAPLTRVAHAVARRGEQDMSPVSAAGAPAEVLPLTSAINALLARVNDLLTAQRRFIADAAHQLRTPLAGLSAQTEVALAEREPEAIRGALHRLRASTRRAVRLGNQLLTLARAEPGADPQHDFHELDLAKTVQDVCAEWVPEALAQDVDLGYSGITTPVFVRGNEVLLGELLGNLIDNAVRYGRRPGTVTVRLEAGERIELAVEDDGPGIAAGERERVFERFKRLPGTTSSGSGLGLAIVREIALAHGGEVRLETSAAGGCLFRVFLPRARMDE